MLLVTIGRHPLLPAAQVRSMHDELADLRDLSPRAIYRWAIAHGWSVDEAGNWAAWCSGIDLDDGDELPKAGWTLRAVGHALFLRYLHETDQIGGPTDSRRPPATSPTAPGSSPAPGPKG
jgi:hypothetical protein